ncbi:T6SS immunity protein Tli4 family protein [Cupriavidus sp. 2KB_3]|uniref:T6SS immunity protein Tli4 family protein n=1 Tax=Cupriavidus TaxID=106589 RepID=UPI0011EF7B8A|nr:T6SS immunity protein Tli4 family protein [Cupriavidus campinensis]
MMKRYVVISALAGVALVLPACGKTPPLTPQEQQTVNALTSNLTPRCVGRHLIDLPADATVGGVVTLQDALIETEIMSIDAFNKEISERETELKAVKSIDAHPFLYLNVPAWDEHSRYFMHRGSERSHIANRILEGYRWENGVRVKVTLEASDFSSPDQADDPIVQRMDIKNDVPAKANHVFELLTNFRGRAENEIPTEPGFCLPDGLILGKAREEEYLNVTFVPASHLDVDFTIATDSSRIGTTSLLQRHHQIEEALKHVDGARTVRKGKVALRDVEAEEWLLVGPRPTTEVQGHMFALEANALAYDVLAPFVRLDMETANPLPDYRPLERASLTDGEALAVWDAISRTLRPRPNGF